MKFETREDLLDQNKDLRERLGEAEATLRAIQRGEVDAFVGSGLDGDCVYTLKGADEAYRTMVEHMAEGALTVTFEGLILFSNEQFARLLRIPLGRVIGARAYDFVQAEDAALLAALLVGPSGMKAEVLLSREDGTSIPAYVSANRLVLDGTECVCLLVADLSEQKRNLEIVAAREAFRELSAQRGLALEAGRLGAWEYRFDTGQIHWDERCRDMFGISTGEQIGYDTMMAMLYPGDREATEAAFTQAIGGARGGSYRREFRVVLPNGSTHWLSSHGQVFFEGDGESRRAVRFPGVSMDINERREAEAKLRQTQKLEHTGIMAAGVAHDFNNLLTVIMGNAISVSEERPHCEQLKAIVFASERAAQLTRQLLAYAGKGQAVIEIVDLTELVRQSTRLFTASVPKHVNLTFNLSDTLPCLDADPSQIEQILMNLVINAGEAIPPKSDGRIRIAAESCEVSRDMARRHSKGYDVADGSYIRLEVTDNGVGMNEATVSRIFDPFFTTKFLGRGLGLAALHGIVRANGGFIDVFSSPGAGTTFRVYLPASVKKRPRKITAVGPRPQQRGFSTILVVDDEELVRRVACVILIHHGYKVLEAGNGEEALTVLANCSALPDLILLDFDMPLMNAHALVPVLAAKYPALRILICSGYAGDVAVGIFWDRVAGFLQKPYSTAKLVEKIEESLGAPSQTAAASVSTAQG